MKKTVDTTSRNTAAICLNWIETGDSANSVQRPTVSLSLKSLTVASV